MNDDLAPLFADDQAGPALPVAWRQGVIVTFDPITLANTVTVGATPMNDLPLLGVGEATILVPGAAVGILVVGGPSKTMFITGRIVVPSTDDATNATALLNSQIISDFILTQETCASTTFTDLTTPGPSVTVNVGGTGRLLIIATSQIQFITGAAANVLGAGAAGLQFAGANVRAPSSVIDPVLPYWGNNTVVSAGTVAIAPGGTVTGQATYSGLNPGLTTITMKYVKSTAPGAANVDFGRRGLTVIKL